MIKFLARARDGPPLVLNIEFPVKNSNRDKQNALQAIPGSKDEKSRPGE
jgi:hypothetical protein